MFNSAFLENGEKIYGSDSFRKGDRHDFVCLRNGDTIARVVALVRVFLFGSKDFVLLERAIEQSFPRLSFLGCTIISESDEWFWVSITDIKEPLCVLPIMEHKAWYYLIRNKFEESIWT